MIPMICPGCGGRWVALHEGMTLHGDRASYHFHHDALRCPRCGNEGEANHDALLEYQRHPDVVASRV